MTDRRGDARGGERRRILVIMHGALGDFVLACGPFQAIRRHHHPDHVTLLTTPPFVDLARNSPWFDDVWADARPPLWRPDLWLALRRRLLAAGFDRVYDLQGSDRTGWYFRFFPRAARPEWSGIAAGCSHPHRNPQRRRMHSADLRAEQLAVAGIPSVPPPDLSWLDADVARFRLTAPWALLVPGGSAHRPEKRWPAAGYAALAADLSGAGIRPLLIGATAEADVMAEIAAAVPAAVNLVGDTSLPEIAALARRASLAVGNDTGPMHLIAAAGCPTLTLFSAASDPRRSAPRGRHVAILQHPKLTDLPAADVHAAAQRLMAEAAAP